MLETLSLFLGIWLLFLLLVGVAVLQFRLVSRGVRGDGGKA